MCMDLPMGKCAISVQRRLLLKAPKRAPESVVRPAGQRSVPAAPSHWAIRGDHPVWCWRYNAQTQPGLGDRGNRAVPARV